MRYICAWRQRITMNKFQSPIIITSRILLFVLLALSAACSTVKNMTISEDVKPWEKDILAQKPMQIPPDDMLNFSDEHIFFSKEASSGGNGVGGGGCGCN